MNNYLHKLKISNYFDVFPFMESSYSPNILSLANSEATLIRNNIWIINNQIKNIILWYPDHVTSVNYLQKKFKSLDLQGEHMNWLNKCPCCFEVYFKNDEYHCHLT